MKRFATATLSVFGCLGALLAPPAAWAGEDEAYGGTPAGGSDGSGGAVPEPVPAGDDRGLNAGPGALLGRAQRVSGTMPGAGAGRTVLLELGDGSSGWVTVAQARTRAGGTFRAVWRANRVGRYTLRAVLSRDGRAGSSARRAALTASVTVYEPGVATVFGPGFYGRRTACRSVLAPTTVGVAHRSLPCGARVEVFYGGRRLVVPVVDRGPYVTGVSWDLTTAAARALRFPGKAWVGTIGTGPAARN